MKMIWLVLGCGAALGQSVRERPAFDVASVKQAPGPSGDSIAMGYSTTFGQIAFRNLTMKELLIEAYRVKEYQIAGPPWLDDYNIRFVIEARCPPETKDEQVRRMLQSLLGERFGLKLHHESQNLPVYGLVAEAGRTKLQKTTIETAGGFSHGSTGPGMISGNYSLPDFAHSLSRIVDRPVLDQTDLDGLFQIDLTWTAQDSASVFTAIRQQLGLKLVAKKAPIDSLVIDHLEKSPTAN